MAVPNQISDLLTLAASNSPAGSDAIGTSLDDYLRAVQAILAQEMEKLKPKYTVGGTANAITLTPANVTYPSAYATGDIYSFIATAANTGATIVNVNAIGVKNVYKQTPTGTVAALTGAEIQIGQVVDIVYNGTQFVIKNPLGSAYKAKSFTYDVSTVSGNQTITGVGFQPKAAFFTAGFGTGGNAAFMSWGQDDGVTAFSWFNSASGFTANLNGGASIPGFVSGGNTAVGLINAFNSDGCVIAWTKTGAPTGILTVNAIFYR